MKAISLFVCSVALLTGCATNPFAQSYQSYTNQMPLAVQQRLLPSEPQPQVIVTSTRDFQDEIRRLQERWLVLIGFAGFRGSAPTQQQLVTQAKHVGADTVLYTSEYSHTEQGVMPLLSYQPGRTYSTYQYGTANTTATSGGYRASGHGTYSGTSVTTTPGSLHTDYVPYQNQVFEHAAFFWRRRKPGIFGVNVAPLPDSARSTLQRNTGALVEVVMQDSPAFRANILRGDVIIQLADKQIASVEDFIEAVPLHEGKKIQVKVIRGTQTIDIDVHLRVND